MKPLKKMTHLMNCRRYLLGLCGILTMLLTACSLPILPAASTPSMALTLDAAAGKGGSPTSQNSQLAAKTPVRTVTKRPTAQPTKTRTATISPTVTLTPTLTFPAVPAEAISFRTGATSGSVTGHLKEGGQAEYYFWGAGGQLLVAAVKSSTNDVLMSISGQDGSTLLSEENKASTFQGRIKRTQDYYVTLTAGGADSDYDFQIILPFDIVFHPGGTAAMVTGYLNAKQTNYYLLRVSEGQTLTVTLTPPTGKIFLTIVGITDGKTLVDAQEEKTIWSGKLPLTQDYMIEAVSTGGDMSYKLKTVVK